MSHTTEDIVCAYAFMTSEAAPAPPLPVTALLTPGLLTLTSSPHTRALAATDPRIAAECLDIADILASLPPPSAPPSARTSARTSAPPSSSTSASTSASQPPLSSGEGVTSPDLRTAVVAGVAAFAAAQPLSPAAAAVLAAPQNEHRLVLLAASAVLAGTVAPGRLFAALVAGRPDDAVVPALVVANAPFVLLAAVEAAARASPPHSALLRTLAACDPAAVRVGRAVLLGHALSPPAVELALELTAAHAPEALAQVVDAALAEPLWLSSVGLSETVGATVDTLLAVPGAGATALKLLVGLAGLAQVALPQRVVEAGLRVAAEGARTSLAVCQYGLAFMLVVPSIGSMVGNAPVVATLRAMRDAEVATDLLLLVAIHFHTGAHVAVADLVRSLTAMPVALRNESLSAIARVVTSPELFEEAAIAAAAPSLPHSATACVFHLVSNGVVAKHGVDVSQWVLAAMNAAAAPLDPVLVALVVAMAERVERSNAAWKAGANHRFPPAAIEAIFETHTPGATVTLPAVLASLYVLTVRLADVAAGVHDAPYAALAAAVPAQALWAALASPALAVVEPSLTRLLIVHRPELFVVGQLLVADPLGCDATLGSGRVAEPMAPDAAAHTVEKAAAAGDMAAVGVLLDAAAQASDATVAAVLGVVVRRVVPMEVEGELEGEASRALGAFLQRAMAVDGWRVCAEVALCVQDGAGVAVEQVKHDPLVFLRVPTQVLLSPVLLGVVLHGVEMGLAASGAAVLMAREGTADEAATLLMAQESAAVLMVLEALGAAVAGGVHEAMAALCAFVHQRFIENVLLCKLVHFQGYAPELLPVLVAGVPSMHVCASFVVEMVDAPFAQHVRFGTLLAAAIAVRYPLPALAHAVAHIRTRAREMLPAADAGVQDALQVLDRVFGAHAAT